MTSPIDEAAAIRTAEGPQEALADTELKNSVRSVLALLPIHFREVLHLRYMERMEYITIAKELNLPVGTVKTWLFRAKQAFIKEAESAGIVF